MKSFRILRAVSKENLPSGVHRHALPPGWPIPLNCNGEIVDPVFRFVRQNYRSVVVNEKFNTQCAVTHDLKDWWDFLSYYKLEWTDISIRDFYSYRDAMLGTLSPLTKRPYSYATVLRRVGSVIRFYEWCNKYEHTKIELPDEIDTRAVPTYTNLFTQTQSTKTLTKAIVAGIGISPDNSVKYITVPQIEKLREQLGPLPSEYSDTGIESRNRLVFEMMLNTGLRISEVLGLLVEDFDHLEIADLIDQDRLSFLIHRGTKRNKRRKILMPVWLIMEVNQYIATERARAFKLHRMATRIANMQDPTALFVNGHASKAYAGAPLRPNRYWNIFHNACIAAVLTKKKHTRMSPKDEGEITDTALFSPHHLRHTYAINEYHAQRMAGNAEPWKLIQTVLGHKYLVTTQETYLSTCSLFETGVSQASLEHLINIAGYPYS